MYKYLNVIFVTTDTNYIMTYLGSDIMSVNYVVNQGTSQGNTFAIKGQTV